MPKNWWILFPLKGLEITDEEHDLTNPLWSDSSIISKSHAATLIKSMKLNEGNTSGQDDERDLISLMKNVALGEDFQSFIVVKRSARLNDVSEELRHHRHWSFAEDSRRRGSQIAALVELAVLVRRSDWMTCALVDQVHRRRKPVIMLSIDDSSNVVMGGGGSAGRTILPAQDNERWSRHDMKARLGSHPIAPLATILSNQGPSISLSLYNAVSEASIRLSDALHAIRQADQLLGAVTAIEILLTDQPERFDIIKNRIRTLIGQHAMTIFRQKCCSRQGTHTYIKGAILIIERWF